MPSHKLRSGRASLSCSPCSSSSSSPGTRNLGPADPRRANGGRSWALGRGTRTPRVWGFGMGRTVPEACEGEEVMGTGCITFSMTPWSWIKDTTNWFQKIWYSVFPKFPGVHKHYIYIYIYAPHFNPNSLLAVFAHQFLSRCHLHYCHHHHGRPFFGLAVWLLGSSV